VSPWSNAYDVFLEKTADLAAVPEREAIAIGNDFEEPLLRWAAAQLGLEIQMNVEVVEPGANPIFAANLDAMVPAGRLGLEAKTGTGSEYGREGTDEVPERVIVQVQHQCFVGELDLVWVPVLIARFDRLERVMYRVKRNDDLIKVVVERGREFWQNHVLPRVPPSDLLPSLGVLRRLRRVPEKVVSVDAGLVEAWRAARAARLEDEKAEAAAAAELIAALGDAEGAEFGDPKKIVTYRGHQRTDTDVKRLRAEMPEVYAAYRRTSEVAPSLKEVNK
jgi:predicted phage-related endonuclease